MLYQAEKTLTDNRDKIAEADRTRVESVLAEAKQDLESNDAARMDAARLDAGRQRLEQAAHKAMEVLYKSQAAGDAGAPGAAPGADAGQRGGDDVIDAEFTEEKGN
jgi:molecular chaperone DnaK